MTSTREKFQNAPLSTLFAHNEGVEQNPIWSAVDQYTTSHLSNHRDLDVALSYAVENGLPTIASNPTLAKFLALQAKATHAAHVLEVGTLGGYTSIWLATLNPGIKVTTLELDKQHAEVARTSIARAGVADQVEVLVGNALETLPKLLNEIEAGQRPRFGLTYIDADKKSNMFYFDHAVKASRPGAPIFIDNIVYKGDLVNEDLFDTPTVRGSREIVENAGKDSRVEAVVMQTVAEKSYDGFLMAVVN